MKITVDKSTIGGIVIAVSGVAVGLVMGAIAFGFEVEDEALGEVFFVFNDSDERECGLGHGVGVVRRV